MPTRIEQMPKPLRDEIEVIIAEIQSAPGSTSAEWKTSMEVIFRTHRFEVQQGLMVLNRGDGYHGRIGLVCMRPDLTIAIEIGNQSIRRKALTKFSELRSDVLRLVGLRNGTANGAVPGVDYVFSRKQPDC